MHRPAFRSVLELTCRSVLPTRPSASSASAIVSSSPAAAATFSTTSSQSVLKWVPSSKERQAQAASELSSLDDDSASAAAAAPAKPKGANPQFSKEGPAGSSSNAISPGSGNQIINVRSLPRTLGPRFPGTGVSDASTSNTGGRFRNSVEGGGNRFSGLGSANLITPRPRGRTDGRLRSARTKTRPDRAKRAKRDGDKEVKRAEGLTEEQEQELYVEAREWLHFHEFGKPEAFEPSLTREGLLGYSPAVASSAAAPDGYLSTALRSMRVMAGGQPFAGSFEPGESHTDASPNPEGVRNQMHKKEVVFFDTMVERVRTERALRSNRALAKLKAAGLPADTPLIKPVSEVTKAMILEAAVRGLYDGPSTAASKDGSLLDTTQRYQAQDYTYSSPKAQQFEAKIRELMPKASAGKAAAKSPRA
ncbi:hypothetical protein F503_05196 [Ophiostoma piceae UAMH 11346]|uniref:Uncharacterized protein n=1 Tax=Ophiostoma piceae (strain UAMH 11346) TaxID=1262450 RepID=S3CDL1_OPHP1|nr:hypothetical protein F503_05196 [Ophiostoma piceae UAMH 11346]